jgi:Methyltransferase FkbM domain
MQMELEIDKGDYYLESVAPMAISLIKLDVEGYEEAALRGLSNIIHLHRPIILFELLAHRDFERAERVLEVFREFGYSNFYTCDRPRTTSPSVFYKILFRLVNGVNLIPRRFEVLEKLEYPMLVASSDPLDL